MSPDQVVRDSYQTTLFSDAKSAAAFIQSETAPTARIAIIGSEPEIPFYAHRRSATGHVYLYPLMDQRDFADRMQQDMIKDIERARPEFVLYVDEPYSWRTLPQSSKRLLQWWSTWSSTNLDLVKTFEITLGREKDPLSQKADSERRTAQPASGYLHVYKTRLGFGQN